MIWCWCGQGHRASRDEGLSGFDFLLSFPRSTHHQSRITHDKGWEVERGIRIGRLCMVLLLFRHYHYPSIHYSFSAVDCLSFVCSYLVCQIFLHFPPCHNHSIPHAAPFLNLCILHLFIGLVCLRHHTPASCTRSISHFSLASDSTQSPRSLMVFKVHPIDACIISYITCLVGYTYTYLLTLFFSI